MILDQLQSAIADRYKVERELGRGGMATVFLATDVRHDRRVAIKVLHPDLAATIGAERFEREIKLAAKLQHPHILGLIDSGEANGLFYYVMPFIEGESVRDKLDREKQLSVDEALQITLEVADALGYAHAQNIIHRDIKPENVMMSNGHALVADFGIARARTEAGQSKLTQTGMAVGTPVYMSPEQATGESVGPSADIYSLGCMLYEMLAGEPPFQGPNAMAIMARHAMEAVPSVRIIRPAVPEEVEEAILAAMEKSVADRPKTAADFCEILGTPLGATATRRVTGRHTARHRVPTGARLPAFTTAEAQAKLATKEVPVWRRPPIASAAVIGLAAIGFVVFQMASGGSPPPTADPLDRKVAVRYFSVDGGDVAVEELRPVADRLTQALIRDLTSTSRLTVISENGVAPFRNPDIPPDSVAKALKVGTMVQGTIERDGANRVAISAHLYDRSGANKGQSIRISVSRDSLFAAEDSVARRVSAQLREVLGAEISDREMQGGTRNSTAWTEFSRAERSRRDAAAFGPANRDSAIARLNAADSLLRLARNADRDWVEPALQAVQVAFDRRRYVPPADVGATLDTALARVDLALKIAPTNGKAFELRGTIKYEQWRVGRLTLDPVERNALLASAEEDLLTALQRDDRLVTPAATLAFLYYDKKDVHASLAQARNAYEADEFLTNSAAILSRLFYGLYDTEQIQEARQRCDEGARRFPRALHFTLCQLWLQLHQDVQPDVAKAWQLAARIDSIAPATDSAFYSHMARMIVGGIIGREAKGMAAGPQQTAGLDSARRVLERAQADKSIDQRQELPGYRAVMLAQFGDNEQAISMLTAYVAANPDHSFRVGGNVHWWWRGIREHPRFRTLLDRTK